MTQATLARTFDKQPGESYPIAVEYENKLPSGTTLVSGTVSARLLPGLTLDNSVLGSTNATLDSTRLKVKVQAGTDGNDYKITFLATLSDASILEDDIVMRVRAL